MVQICIILGIELFSEKGELGRKRFGWGKGREGGKRIELW
jgi:hypothetical protein